MGWSLTIPAIVLAVLFAGGCSKTTSPTAPTSAQSIPLPSPSMLGGATGAGSTVAILSADAGRRMREALISLDDHRYGSDSVTLDTITGLEWLDLTKSRGRSFNDIIGYDGSNEFAARGDFAGFRYATADEVRTLFVDAGIQSIDAVNKAIGYSDVAALQALVGVTSIFSEPFDDGTSTFSIGFSATVSTPGGRQSPVLILHDAGVNNPFSYGYAFINNNVNDGTAAPEYGSWLVRARGRAEH